MVVKAPVAAGWWRASRLLLLGSSVAALAEAGHLLLERFGEAAAHHVFHLAFPMAAVMFFGLYVAMDVRRNGWPRFSWRLHPEETSQEEMTHPT